MSVPLRLMIYKTFCPNEGCRSMIEHQTAREPIGQGWRRRRGRGLICLACIIKEEEQERAERAARPRKPQGFAAMSPERRREVAAQGGRTAHAKGVAHEWTSEEARRAGVKQGKTFKAYNAILEKAKAPKG